MFGLLVAGIARHSFSGGGLLVAGYLFIVYRLSFIVYRYWLLVACYWLVTF
jgi:hypothetical protein